MRAARTRVATAGFPKTFGVYVVYELGMSEPLYIGVAATETIEQRWRRFHLRNRAGGSALRRSLGPYLGLVDVKLTKKAGRYYPPKVEEAITTFLETCAVEFFPTATEKDADDLEVELRERLKPRLNISRARRRRSLPER